MRKRQLRETIRERKRTFTQGQLETMSLTVVRRLCQHPRLLKARKVLVYYSLPDEVNTHDLLDCLAQGDKDVYLPVVVDAENMELRQYQGENRMCEGAFHILEPVGEPFSRYDEIDVAIVPGMAFDAAGHRLGRGRGYYDRLLAKMSQTYKIGVCFDFQRVSLVPVEETDVRMDEVI